MEMLYVGIFEAENIDSCVDGIVQYESHNGNSFLVSESLQLNI